MEPNRWGDVSKILGTLVVVTALAVAAGCSSTSSAPCSGKERCPCYANMTCNSGLLCLSNICVSGGTGGSTGGGLGGMAATGSGGGGGASLGVGGNATGAGGNATGTGGSTGTGGTPGATNLIKNGDFSQGKTYWDLTYQAGEVASSMYTGGEYCVFNESSALYLSFSLGYPPTPSDAFVIAPGVPYTLSYRARFAQAVSAALLPAITVKIGHASPPYDALTSFTGDNVNSANYLSFTHSINSATGDTGAGLVFNATLDYLTEICFDDVTLVKN